MATLKATGQYENTLIVYTADQGFAMGEHGFRSKVAPYDANYRSPLIVSMPARFASGQVCSQSMSGADLMATLVANMGVKVPWPMHGRDFTALLKDPQAAWSEPCFYENMGQRYGKDVLSHLNGGEVAKDHKHFPPYVCVVKGGWKLIHYLKSEHGEELYDLNSDKEELTNLIHEPTQAERLKQLRQQLREELKRTAAPFEI
jgi:arylsulfatase A-like enzyme